MNKTNTNYFGTDSDAKLVVFLSGTTNSNSSKKHDKATS